MYFYSEMGTIYREKQVDHYCIKVRNGKFMYSNGEWKEEPRYFSNDYLHDYVGGFYIPKKPDSYIYASPFFNGKYLVYSSYEHTDTSDTHFGFPVNLLPNSPKGEGPLYNNGQLVFLYK